MTTVGVGEAKTPLPTLLREVQGGGEVVVEREGQAVARLIPVTRPGLVPGTEKGRFHVADDVDAPMPPEVQAAFE